VRFLDKKAAIPDDKASWLKAWDITDKKIQDELVEIVKTDDGIVGTYYKSCMNEDAVNKLGNKPLQPLLKSVESVKDLPSLTSHLAHMGRNDNGAFFSWYVDADSQHPERRAVFLAPGGMTLPDKSYYTSNEKDMLKHRSMEVETIVKLLTNAGIPAEDAKQDALNVLALETRTAETTMDREQARGSHGKRLTRDELQSIAPSIDWESFFHGVEIPDAGVEGGPQLIMQDEDYFKQLASIFTDPNPRLTSSLADTGKPPADPLVYKPTTELTLDKEFDAEDAKALRSYLRYTTAASYVAVLPGDDFGAVMLPMFTDLYGLKERPARWKKCYGSTKGAMGGHLSQLYIKHFFPEANKETATEMLDNIRDQFRSNLETVPWMDESTRPKAIHKLDEMVFEVAYPSEWPEWCEITGLKEDTFFENYRKVEKCRFSKEKKRVREPVKRRAWTAAGSTDVNAYYSQKVNGLFIPAAVLQEPFFDAKYPSARNAGGLGAVLGHEMTHGFDDEGRQYDAKGMRHEWWDSKTVKNFDDRAQCINDQFSSYTLDGKPVSGKLTLGEDIADSGGLKMSFLAWKKGKERTPEEERLFFLSFAQTWCGIERTKAADTGLFDAHAPRKWRVIGTLSDSDGFSKAYQCKPGSTMNRGAKSCTLW